MTKIRHTLFFFPLLYFFALYSSKAESFASFSCSNYILKVIKKKGKRKSNFPFYQNIIYFYQLLQPYVLPRSCIGW